MDCKDYQKPVDMKNVEEFIGLVEDVGANKGAMVSAAGYSTAAQHRAQDSGIDLFRMVDAQSKDWPSYVTIPVVCDFRSIRCWKATLKAEPKILNGFASYPTHLIPIFKADQSLFGSVQSLLWELWNKNLISMDPGEYKNLRPKILDTFVQVTDNLYSPLEIIYDVVIERKLYFGQLPLTKAIGLRDELSGRFILPSGTPIETDWISPEEVELGWQIFPSLESLAIKPLMMLSARDRYPVKP
jgi:hypothetical protein